MKLFDTHFHYSTEDTPEQYQQAIQACLRETDGIPLPERLYLLANGGDYEESCRARDFARAIPDAWFAAGVHPHCAESDTHPLTDFTPLLADPQCAAVGEIGLDYFYDQAPRKQQRQVLENFLELALQTSLPAVLHCRDREDEWGAYDDLYKALQPFADAGGRMVIHCFAGTPEWAEKFLALGASLGVTGMVTFSRADNIREVLRMIPDDRLLIETDAPYLAPVPHRGKPNTPGYLPLIAARIAREKGRSVEEIAQLTTANALTFFRLEGRN